MKCIFVHDTETIYPKEEILNEFINLRSKIQKIRDQLTDVERERETKWWTKFYEKLSGPQITVCLKCTLVIDETEQIRKQAVLFLQKMEIELALHNQREKKYELQMQRRSQEKEKRIQIARKIAEKKIGELSIPNEEVGNLGVVEEN